MPHTVLRSLLWSMLTASAASQSIVVYAEDGPGILTTSSASQSLVVHAEDGPSILDVISTGIGIAGALCAATGPENPACMGAVVGEAAFFVLEGCWWLFEPQQKRSTMAYLQADYGEMERVLNDMVDQMSGWINVTNQTSAETFETLSLSSQAIVDLADNFLQITNRAISSTMGRLRVTGSNSVVWSSALLVVPGKWGSSALRSSSSMPGNGPDDSRDQQAYDLLVKISSNMGTAIVEVQGIQKCVANPFHVSCSTDELNDLMETSKADFTRLQGYMRSLGDLVNSMETNALAASAMASPLKLSATAPAPSDAGTMDALQALLRQESQMELEAQKELRWYGVYAPAAIVAALLALLCGFLSCALVKCRMERMCRVREPLSGEGSVPFQKMFTASVPLTALSGLAFLSLSAYCMLMHLSTDPQASLDRLYNLESYTHSTLTFAKTLNACARFPCESGYVNDAVDALVNLTVQLLTDVVL